jgi:deoxycytidine triphosphate deaminase
MAITKKHESRILWDDPDENICSGVLLSDRIRFYVEEIDLIAPFEEKNLGPASYDLRLGRTCWFSTHAKESGLASKTLTDGEVLTIPPNSIVFISTYETLNLPFYLVGRFNLRLRLLHEGLLVGTGPQIDPGFSGSLSCPLHNISSEMISLKCGARFAVIEFQKTTPFAETIRWLPEDNIKRIREDGEAKKLPGKEGYPCLTFPLRSLNREPVKGYLPVGKVVSSSIDGLAKELESQKKILADKEVDLKSRLKDHIEAVEKRLNTVTVISFITIVAVVFSVFTLLFNVFNWKSTQYQDMLLRLERAETALSNFASNLNAHSKSQSQVSPITSPSTALPALTGAQIAPSSQIDSTYTNAPALVP